MSIKYVDAKRLRRILIGGASWVKKYEDHLNELNVYPVPDGDTGSNMSMTLETMKKAIETETTKKSSMQEVVDVVEEAVLMGARGNSGTILSQIITGFLKSIGTKKRLNVEDIALALKSAKETAYTAVETPVEGTILTVIREVSEHAKEVAETTDNLDEMLEKINIIAKEAVDKTPELLPKLKEANVVDSGAMGLFYFLEGILKTLTEIESIALIETEEKKFSEKISDFSHDPAEITFKYCTEFIIRNADFDIPKFKEDVLKLGDSAVFAQTSKKFKIHIHTNNPGQALELAVAHGDLEKIKIENMKLQNEGLLVSEKEQTKIFVNQKSNFSKYSYVILADSIKLKDEFLNMGADVVILGGQSQNPSVSDILNAIAKINSNKNILILPNNKNVISTANIAADKTEKNVSIIPTKTMLEGYFFIKNSFENIDLLKYENENNYSIEITQAVRDTKVDDIVIKKDDYIALVNTKIKHANSSLSDLVKEINTNYVIDYDFVTILSGNEDNNEINKEFEFIRKYKMIEANLENYLYYIYVEKKNPNRSKFAIVTDSSADLSDDDIKDLPIYITPLKVDGNNHVYKDGVDLSKEEFWNLLTKEGIMFKTAQPSPKDFSSLYTHLINRGYEKIIGLYISHKLSGTANVATLTAKNLNILDKITIINTDFVSIPLNALIVGVAKKLKNTQNMDEILRYIENVKNKSKTLVAITDLKYLEKGGRISSVQKSIGDFFNLKPIATLTNGRVTIEKKVFGESSQISYFEKTINEIIKTHSIFLYFGSDGSPKSMNALNQLLEKYKNNSKVTVVSKDILVGATVASHTGPAYGISIIPKLL